MTQRSGRIRSILVIDIGGSHVKCRLSNRRRIERFESDASMTPRQVVREVLRRTRQQRFGFVTIGFPGMVVDGYIVCEPANLGAGWVGFDFEEAFGRPTRIVNDAAMQALGSYSGGRMLFLGFGTGLGAVLIDRNRIYPMELSHLPFSQRGQVQSFVGDEARAKLGVTRWAGNAKLLIRELKHALEADSVVIGGGNAGRIKWLPRGVCRGENDLAFRGGVRVWRWPRMC